MSEVNTPAASPAPAPAASPAATPAPAPWYSSVAGIDNEMIGHLQNAGWDKLTPAEAAIKATKSFKEAEKFIGAPADQILRLPKDATDEAAINTMWTRLGRPTDANGYDFSGIKFEDGSALDDKFSSMMKETAFKLNLPKEAATALVEQFAKHLEGAEKSDNAEMAAKLVNEKTELSKNWGANFEANKFVASNAAKALGVDPNTVALLENQIGYAKVMEMFRNIGVKIGEDKYIAGNNPQGQNGVMTREQASARKGELMGDKAWVKDYLAGDAAKNREMTALNTMIVGDGKSYM